MPSSPDAGARRALRDTPLGKAAVLLAVLAAALLVARSCGSSEPRVTKEEAVEIARREIDFRPDGVQVRNAPRTLQGRRVWAVSLYTGTAEQPERVTVVEVDAETGRVTAIHGDG